MPSPVTSFAKTTATSGVLRGRTAAASIPGSGGCQPRCSSLPVIDALAAYSTVIGTLCPACRCTMPWKVWSGAPGEVPATPPVGEPPSRLIHSASPPAICCPLMNSFALPATLRENL